MTTFINVIVVFVLAYLIPLFTLKAIYREPIRARMLFWFAVFVTLFIFNNNIL